MPESSADPKFWNTRYAAGRTPWDFGGVPAALGRFVTTNAATLRHGMRVLIPGCGSGYEIAAFAAAGCAVTAIDLSAVAVARVRREFGALASLRIVEGDFFTEKFSAAPFDLIYERTFLCALPPALWPRMVARTAELLRPGGVLAGFYLFGDKDDGPPFGLAPDEPAKLFAAHFDLARDEAVPPAESLAFFAGRERWQERTHKKA